MKKIFLFWGLFAVVFSSIVAVSYSLGIDENIVIGALLVEYAAFQVFSLWQAFKHGRDWIIASIFLQAIMALCSPLYYSNFGDPVYEYTTGTWFNAEDALFPCQLCWWARIMMFPIIPLSLIALYTKSRPILAYIYAITIPGMALEAFHYILQKPGIVGRTVIENPFGCTAANPCSALHVDYMGIITIPLLCFIAFLIIHIFATLALFSKKIEKATK
ncbi:disulfide bond formation protein B [Candidatus Gracilibacteria bacterium]|nr:disulfide bond formation protein B [Candidatus Gracilibacteria bacterium]